MAKGQLSAINAANVTGAAKSLHFLCSQLIRKLPGISKLLFWLLLLVNIRSFPLAWHIRVFRPALRLRLQYYLSRIRYLFKPRSVHATEKELWFDSISPIGRNPFEYVTVYKTWASVDDCDFNGHLSNSSYAKTLDAARIKVAISYFPSLFRAGGWIALAGTHYSFIREIPMFASYEVRVSTVGWDNKWLFVMARFVTYSKAKKSQSQTPEDTRPGTPDATFNPSLRITSNVSTPPSHLSPRTAPNSAAATVKALTAGLSQTEEPDGAILHCVHISQICFKVGRITVPPAVVIASNGFSSPPSSSISEVTPQSAYSHGNPPPHWMHVRALRCVPEGSMKAFMSFLKGGWRNVPEGERWWEAALAGPVEEQRRANMGALDAVRNGMEVARGFHLLSHVC